MLIPASLWRQILALRQGQQIPSTENVLTSSDGSGSTPPTTTNQPPPTTTNQQTTTGGSGGETNANAVAGGATPRNVVSEQRIEGSPSGLETIGGGAVSKALMSGGLDMLGGLLQSRLASRLIPDISKSNTQLAKDLQQNIADVARWLQTNQLGDIGQAAATRAQLAYQQSLSTPQAIANLARSEAAAKSLESLGAAAVGQAISALDKDRRAAMMALARSGATPNMMIGALQRMGAEAGGRTQDIINAAIQQGMQATAQAQNLRNQALRGLMEQQQLSYQTKVVPTLNQFQFGPLAQLAGTPLQTASEAVSQNYVLPPSPLAPLAQVFANEAAMRNLAGLTVGGLRKGIEGARRLVYGGESSDLGAYKQGAAEALQEENNRMQQGNSGGNVPVPGQPIGTGGNNNATTTGQAINNIPEARQTTAISGDPMWLYKLYQPGDRILDYALNIPQIARYTWNNRG